MKATISEVLADPTLVAGDIILVHESAYSVAVAADPNNRIQGFDPKLTTYPEDILFPPFDIEIKVDLINPGIGNVVEIQGTGLGSVVSFTTPSNTRASLLEGFTISGGTGSVDGWLGNSTLMVGGGVQCLGATPTIRNCTIKGNTATLGGGLYASPGAFGGGFANGPLIEDCIVAGNQVVTGSYVQLPLPAFSFTEAGGGICSVHCSPEIRGTTVKWNTSVVHGGGIAFMNPPADQFGTPPTVRPILEDSLIHDNKTETHGGGIYVWVNVNPLIQQCLISYNTAGGSGQSVGRGGGLHWDNSTVDIRTCVIRGNKADVEGGGILFEGEGDRSSDGAPPTPGSSIIHCTIDRNETIDLGMTSGGGIRGRLANDDPMVTTTFENCLIVSNTADTGGGVDLTFSSVSFQNCTISQNLARGTGFTDYSGGVRFDRKTNDNATVFLQDCIIDGNQSSSVAAPNPWEVDLVDITNPAPFVSPVTILNCVMSKATPQFSPFAASPTNLAIQPAFVRGTTWKYFPNGSYYLAHAPQQASTSGAYEKGSQPIGPQFAVDGMTCRTAYNFLDTGAVDIGFHYPGLVGLP